MKSENLKKITISLIIPVRDESVNFEKNLLGISGQTVLPNEIVIVDSSSNNNVKEYIKQYTGTVPIIYHREKKAYPGKARNIGVKLANGDWIAFLDAKTLPKEDWLERYLHLMEAYHADVVFGVTKFDANSPFRTVLRAATYGKIGHHTVPGTLIKKKVFIDSDGFLEHVRMGEDIEWWERLDRMHFNIHRPNEPIVTYIGLTNNFPSTVNKYLTSAYHTARLNILRNVKDAYLSILLILSAIVLPKWNHIIGGWDNNPLFIPHITKIYLIAIIFLFLTYQLIHYLFFRNMSQSVYSKTLQLILIIFITLAVLKWNAVIAAWVEDAVLYVPHITKVYVGGVVLVSIVYRGIILPLNRKVEPSFLFPFKWIRVGLLGLSLDLVKAPGYVVGSFLGFFKQLKTMIYE